MRFFLSPLTEGVAFDTPHTNHPGYDLPTSVTRDSGTTATCRMCCIPPYSPVLQLLHSRGADCRSLGLGQIRNRRRGSFGERRFHIRSKSFFFLCSSTRHQPIYSMKQNVTPHYLHGTVSFSIDLCWGERGRLGPRGEVDTGGCGQGGGAAAAGEGAAAAGCRRERRLMSAGAGSRCRGGGA